MTRAQGEFLPREAEIRRAVELLRSGKLIGMPTETVYGLAGDGLNERSVSEIFRVKGRPEGHPVILHVSRVQDIGIYARAVPDEASALASTFWPGPLTLILKKRPIVPHAVTGGGPTVGLRMPNHPVALAVLRSFGGPLAAPSANRFGRVSPTCRDHVMNDLGDHVQLVLEGGRCDVGVESTIVDLSGDVPRLLRPGSITVEQMARDAGVVVEADNGRGPAAPGTLPSHYAPRARVQVVESEEVWNWVRSLAEQERVGVLTSSAAPEDLAARVVVRRLEGGEAGFAQALYESLRDLDEAGCSVILAARPSMQGIGRAVADRLRRASAPRPHESASGSDDRPKGS